MDPDASDVKAISVIAGRARQSLNCKNLVYAAGDFPNLSLYVSNADGSNAVKPTNDTYGSCDSR